MTVFEVRSDPKGKCISCKYYQYEDDYWVVGDCVCKTNKIKKRTRQHNDKCFFWRRGPVTKLLDANKLEENQLYESTGGICFMVEKIFKNGKIIVRTTNPAKEDHFMEETTKTSQSWFDRFLGPFTKVNL